VNPFKLIRQKFIGYTPEEVDNIAKPGDCFYATKFDNLSMRGETVIQISIEACKNFTSFTGVTSNIIQENNYKIFIMCIPGAYELYGFGGLAKNIAPLFNIKYFRKEK